MVKHEPNQKITVREKLLFSVEKPNGIYLRKTQTATAFRNYAFSMPPMVFECTYEKWQGSSVEALNSTILSVQKLVVQQ